MEVSQLLDKFGEDKIRSRLYNYLCDSFPNDLVVEGWRGWSMRVGKEKVIISQESLI